MDTHQTSLWILLQVDLGVIGPTPEPRTTGDLRRNGFRLSSFAPASRSRAASVILCDRTLSSPQTGCRPSPAPVTVIRLHCVRDSPCPSQTVIASRTGFDSCGLALRKRFPSGSLRQIVASHFLATAFSSALTSDLPPPNGREPPCSHVLFAHRHSLSPVAVTSSDGAHDAPAPHVIRRVIDHPRVA